MRIYTRTGDDGTTGLIGGSRVSKADARIECTGIVDELNAALGVACACADGELAQHLRRVQGELFDLGAHLANPGDRPVHQPLPAIDESMVKRLELEIDTADGQLPPLRTFVLPGGTSLAAHLHLARTICRRAERVVIAFMQDHAVDLLVVVYLNRLSDWLFVQARLANHRAQVDDVPWLPRTS